MNKKQQTIDTYNNSATGLAEKFNSQGVRTSDIAEALSYVNKKNPKVLEIGSGNGRDAAEIIKHTNNYLGIDIAEKMVEIAQSQVPSATFQVADVENFEFEKGLDAVFAFASLIHVPKDSLRNILEKVYLALNSNGVFFLSLKLGPYSEVTKTDEFGTRTQYLYTPEEVISLVTQFKVRRNTINNIRGQEFFEIIFQK